MHPISQKLLQWYSRHKRDLPWRKTQNSRLKTQNPYPILVSEVMLQQTRVDQAIPYYERFLKRFPKVQRLAEAAEDEVLKAWEGLGYYSRARHLREAARIIVQRGWPKSAQALERFPGIGPYISKAVAAIAFNQDAIALDANLLRVGARLFGIQKVVDEPKTKTEIETKFRELLPSGKAGDFNQALMDLGSAVCLPQEPHCPQCPLRAGCAGRRLGIAALLPRKRAKKKKPHQTVVLGVIWQEGKVLIAKRPNKGLLAGLWEFPGGKKENGETLENACAREIEEETGLRATVGRKITVVQHEYSHLKVTLHVFECIAKGKPKITRPWHWVKPEELKTFAMPKVNHKFMDLIV